MTAYYYCCYCGEGVSPHAEICPHCGEPHPATAHSHPFLPKFMRLLGTLLCLLSLCHIVLDTQLFGLHPLLCLLALPAGVSLWLKSKLMALGG